MARIMVVAGGKWQCPIVKMAKDIGNYVICSNLYEDSPAFKYADCGIVANVLDKEENLRIAKSNNIDAVITDQTDIAVTTVSYIAGQLGLKGIPKEIAKRFTNKYEMRKITDEAGFPTPKYALCYTIEQTKEFIKKNGKSIIKPLDSQSSRGCHIISSPNEVETYFDDCIQYSICERAILVEEYIEGTEFTVDGLKTDSQYIVTAISEKEHYSYNKNIAKRLVFSQDNPRYDYDKLREINSAMVGAMELPFGLTHAEYKYNNGNYYLIEIAARGGGTRISSDIVPLMSGINSNYIYVNMMLNENVDIIPGKKKNCAMLGFFDLEAGLVKEIRGVDEAKRLEGVVDIDFEIGVGDLIKPAEDDRSRCGFYIIYADSKEELMLLEEKVLNTVKVEIQ